MSATHVYLDVETVPDQREGAPARALSLIKVPANYSKPETIAKYLDENAEKAWRATALDGGYGELIVIGYAFGDGEPAALYRSHEQPEQEAAMLRAFWDEVAKRAVAQPTWVGHNVLFDLQFLRRRSAILGVSVPPQLPFAPSPWNPHVFCTSYAWTWERNKHISLAELAAILGVSVESDGISGADVWDYARAGRHKELIAYCLEDVQAVRQIHDRLRPAW